MAKIIVVTSGKGGVGKTTTSASIATGLALRGYKTAVIDFDVGLRNLDLIMGCERRVVYDLINVIQGEATLNQALIKDKNCENLFILPASQTRDKDALTREGVEKVMKELGSKKMGFEYIICDSPAGIEQGALMALYFADEAIVTTSSTCTFTMRDEYKHLLEIKNEDVRSSLMLATRFLYNLIHEKKIRLVFRNDFQRKVAYHTACHMERMGWVVYSTELMRMIPGLDLIMLESQCCGIAGTYGFKKENYERSQKIGESLFDHINEINPDCVSTDCETCKWQIEMSTRYKVINPISLIAEALDVEATKQANA